MAFHVRLSDHQHHNFFLKHHLLNEYNKQESFNDNDVKLNKNMCKSCRCYIFSTTCLESLNKQ